MAQVSFTGLRANLARCFDEAESSRAPLLVTRTGRADMVLLSEEEFEGWREAVHLLEQPAQRGAAAGKHQGIGRRAGRGAGADPAGDGGHSGLTG